MQPSPSSFHSLSSSQQSISSPSFNSTHFINSIPTIHSSIQSNTSYNQLNEKPTPITSIPATLENKPTGRFEGGSLLSVSLRDQIRLWIPNQKFSLLYKASRDGFKAKHFHKVCDNKGTTLVIIQSSDNHLFGGYSPNSWDSNSNYLHSPNSFIFTLTNPHSIPPTRYFLKRGNNQSIRCQQHTCAVFGDGDIKIENNAHSSISYSYFPASYYDTTDKRKLTFTGTQSFLSKEVEVYSVTPL